MDICLKEGYRQLLVGIDISARNVSIASLILLTHFWASLWRKQTVICSFLNEVHKVGIPTSLHDPQSLLPILVT